MLDEDTPKKESGPAGRDESGQGREAQPPEASTVRHIQTLWSYRRVLLATVVIGFLGVGVIYIFLPTRSFVCLKFRLLFEGADKGEYPSGVRFSPEDIISKAVLNEVYEKNDLGQYGKLEDIQRALFASTMPSPELQALDADYRNKLASSKLTAVERIQFEKEYTEKRRGLQNAGAHVLTMDVSLVGPMASMPPTLREKMLNDILAVWAEDAAQRKGALKYQVTVLSKNILPREFIMGEDYFITGDILRQKLAKIMSNIDELMALPGAKTFRTPDKKLSLGEIRSNLEDMLRFKLVPALHMIHSSGLTEKEMTTSMYIQGEIYDISQSKKEAADKAKVLEESLIAYIQERRRSAIPTGSEVSPQTGPRAETGVPAMIPQLGESFLDRIVELASQNNDLKFRQDLTEQMTKEGLRGVALDKELSWYQDVQKALSELQAGDKKIPPEQREVMAKIVKETLSVVYEDLTKRADEVEAIFEQLSSKNLNPRSQLYAVNEPVLVVKERLIGMGGMARYGVTLVAAAVFLVALGCLLHARLRSSRAASPAA